VPPPASLEPLDRDEAIALLGARGVCRVVFTVDALPAVLPVNYAVDAADIVLSTSIGSRLAAAADGGVLAVQIDDLDSESRTGWSVVVTGVAEVLPDGEEWRRLRGLLDRWLPERDLVGIRLPMTVVTGRQIFTETIDSR
jgi:nitroimidazol reductase NimA-like FMN-containing flavoprotein (pyridoxamine 5'-phosphate oxidase superfamily)